ncbi:unnamed protein product [Paramecium octaurelia]|uniref:Uncharacterized protein n=1 Tax=Paramecium octaurelia TaxID=43137 RepID=A0A8S1SBD4_PAROT|nr:unnamed protein product [Paramecium octaurelia]
MSLQIDSRVFEVVDQNSMQQLMSFLSLDIQLDGQRYLFKDDQQFKKFQKFRASFDSIKEIFPNFQMKIKPKFGVNNENQNSSFKKDKDEINQRNLSTQINSDQSLTNNKGDQSYQKLCETPTDQGEVQFEQEQIQQKIQQDPKEPEAEVKNSKFESSILTEVENSQDYSMHEFSEKMSEIIDQSMNVYDDKIKIRRNDKTFIIQLKNSQILQIIEQLYLEKWSQLVIQLNLIKQTMNCYKLEKNTDQYYIIQEIQNFIDSIQSVEIQFCFYSCYTMKESQSMMNKYLSQRQVQIAQIGDEFYLVSREQSQQFLKELAQKIYENYRGYMFYFASAKPYPYPNYLSNNPILEKSRYLFYKKYLSQDVQQYSFNQYFNENFFFIEMNFSKVMEKRELIEKQTKEYIGGFLKNLFFLKFSIKTTQDIVLKVEQAFKDGIEDLNFKILFYKNDEDMILFGINEDILKLLIHLENKEFKYQLKKFEVEVDKQNYLFKLRGAQLKIDLKSIIDLLKKFGLQQVENKKLLFSTFQNKDDNFQSLVRILKYFCFNREQNNNRVALQVLHQKFRNAINNKDLQKELQLLKYINFNNIEQLQLQQEQQQQRQVISLNIRAELQQFPISQTITLEPKFLDEIILENLHQEFLDKFVTNQQKIQFFKISQGNYQLQCFNDQVVTQFKQYFDKFQNVRLELDKTSLSCFELSHYLKKELKKRCIYWKVMGPEQLYLITRINESLKYAQDFKYYKGKKISMLSLKETNINEKVEYQQLVLARTNYFKYKIQDFLKQVLTTIKEIEFREEQEISSFCIIHSNYNNQGQQMNRCMEQIQHLIESKIFLELKTKPEIGKKILEKIIDISDLYVSQKQEYQDYYITMLGNKKNFQKIDSLFQRLQLPYEQVINLQISFYIEQFIPYRNVFQQRQNRDKFKKYLEGNGYFVDDANIKWTLEIKQQLSKIMIFQNLIEWTNQNFMPNIRTNDLQELEMIDQSQIQINFSQTSYLEIENSLLHFLDKDYNQNNKGDNRDLQILQQSGQLDKQSFQENQILPLELSQIRSVSETSDQDSHMNLSGLGNQQYDILADFQKGIQQIDFPADSQLGQTIRAYLKNQNILVFQPYVDQNYKEIFSKMTVEFIEIYVVQSADKVYREKFSKKMLFIMKQTIAIEKFLKYPKQILIVFKTNKLHKYNNYQDKEKICLLEDNLVLPYYFLKRK